MKQSNLKSFFLLVIWAEFHFSAFVAVKMWFVDQRTLNVMPVREADAWAPHHISSRGSSGKGLAIYTGTHSSCNVSPN
jgi:hypothetical protein